MEDLRDIVRAHGGDLYAGGRQAVIPGPGHSRKDRSLSLRVSDDGRVVFHSFANDSARDVMSYLGIERGEARPQSREERLRFIRLRDAERRRTAAEARAFCAGVWAGTEPLEGSPAEAYLWSRGLIVEAADVRFHPAGPRTRDPDKVIAPAPAMVAIARDASGDPTGLHLTYVRADGTGKAFGQRSRLMFGMLQECAVRLQPIGAERVLAVGEGIETSAGFAALKGVPAWATLSTSNLKAFRVPRGVRKLLIAADGDQAGLKAAQGLAERACKVCDVEIVPAPSGKDWADVWSAANG